MKIHIKELHSHVAVLVPQEALYGEGFPMANTVKPCNTTGAINPFSSSLHLEDYSSNACVEAPSTPAFIFSATWSGKFLGHSFYCSSSLWIQTLSPSVSLLLKVGKLLRRHINGTYSTLHPLKTYRHNRHHFIALHFIALCRYYIGVLVFVLQIEGLWQPCIEQVYQHHFPTAFAHFVYLCHISVTLTIFQIFS